MHDGVLEDPRRCRFDPGELQCAAASTSDCLSQAQVAALAKIYQGPRNPRIGEQIMPGPMLGSEAPNSWSRRLDPGQMERTAQPIRQMIYDEHWD